MKEVPRSSFRFLSLAIYGILALAQIETPGLLTAGNAGVLVVYLYVGIVVAAALGVVLQSKVAWSTAVAIDVLGVAASLMELDRFHARDFTRITLLLALVRLALLATPWIRAHVGFGLIRGRASSSHANRD